MRLDGIWIEGYGNRKKWDSGLLSPGLNVVSGPNEAGKSTVFSFVRTILYGFSPKTSKHPHFPVGREMEFGGRLNLFWNDESFTLERFLRRSRDAAVLRNSKGQPVEYGDSPGKTLLGVSSDVFSQVFAISLSELRNFVRKEQTEISPYFLGAAERTVESTNPRRVLAMLYQDADAIGRMPGTRRRKPRRLEELKEARKEARNQRREQKELAETARRTAEELKWLEEDWKLLQEQEELLLDEQKKAIRRRQGLEAATKVVEFEAELRDSISLLAFPLELAPDVERLDERTSSLSNREQSEGKRLRDVRRERDAIHVNEKLLQARERFDTLQRRVALMEQHAAEIAELESAVQQQRSRIDTELQRCRVEGGIETLKSCAVKPNLHAEERLIAHQLDEHIAAERTLETEAAGVELVERRLRDAQSELESMREKLPADPDDIQNSPDPSVILELRQSIGLISQLEAELSEAHAEQSRFEDRVWELDEDQGNLDDNTARMRRSVKGWLAGGVVMTLGGLTVLALALMDTIPSTVVTLGLGGSGVAAGLMLLGVWLAIARRCRAAEERLIQFIDPMLAEAKERLNDVGGRVNELEAGLTDKRPQVERQAKELGLPWPVEQETLDSALEKARNYGAAKGDLARVEHSGSAVESLSSEFEQARQKVEQERQRLMEHRSEINTMLQNWGLPDDGTPAHILDGVRTMARLVHDLESVEERSERIQRLGTEHEEFVNDIQAFLDEIDEPTLEDGEMIRTRLEALTERMREEGRREQAAGEMERSLEQVERGLADLRNERAKVDTELQRLLEQAGCPDIESFRSKVKPAEQARNLKDRLQERREDLSAFESPEFLLEEARAALLGDFHDQPGDMVVDTSQDEPVLTSSTAADHGQPDAVDGDATGEAAVDEPSDQDDVDIRLEKLKRKMERLAQTRGQLKQQIAAFKSRIDIAGAESLVLSIEDQRAQAAKEFDVLQVTHALLEEAIERFRRSHQPNVFRRASDFLHTMTGGRYAQVVAPLDEGARMDLEVIPGEPGPAWRADQLSRGTQEQLYLSLRLALADEIMEKEQPVPLFFDDLLVNFDERRLDAAYGLLAEIAKRTQVFLFTCHRRIAEDVAKQLDARTIDLS